jgi:hypothetical protein
VQKKPGRFPPGNAVFYYRGGENNKAALSAVKEMQILILSEGYPFSYLSA